MVLSCKISEMDYKGKAITIGKYFQFIKCKLFPSPAALFLVLLVTTQRGENLSKIWRMLRKKNLGGNISFHILEDGDSISQKCAKVEEW